MPILRLLMLFAVLLAAPVRAADLPALPSYQVDLSQTTVSGLSSGGFMASQFAVAYSSIVTGVGVVAGGPYYCAGYPGVQPYVPYLSNAMSVCMNPAASSVNPPDAQILWTLTRDFAQAGVIDDVANLARQRVYLFSGTKDDTVTSAVVAQVKRYYQLAGVPSANLVYDNTVAAGHGFLTDHPGDVACPLTQTPYINNCHLAQAGAILNQLYPGLQAPATQLSGKILTFNQRTFIHGALSSMSNAAYAYVPASCASQTCRVHVAFHGCEQGVAAIGDRFYAGTGYNYVADTNKIIVLYPQAEPSPLYPYNPKGCWDFWGYTSVNPFLPDFYTRTGTQMAAVKAMLDRLAAPRRAAAKK